MSAMVPNISGKEKWEESEKELYQRIDPIRDELLEVIQHHARFNDAGMSYDDSRDFVLKTLGELL